MKRNIFSTFFLFFLFSISIFAQNSIEKEILDSVYCYAYSDIPGEWNLTSRTIFTYDEKGKLLESFEQDYDLKFEEWINNFRHFYTYDQDGRLLEDEKHCWFQHLDEWVVMSKRVYTYNEFGHEIEWLDLVWNQSWVYNAQYKNTYNSDGNIATSLMYNWDDLAKEWVLSGQNFFEYTSFKALSSILGQKWMDDNWVNTTQRLLTYDGEERLVESLNQFWSAQGWENTQRSYFEYANDGSWKKEELQNWDFDFWVPIEKTFYYYNEEQSLQNETTQTYKPVFYDWMTNLLYQFSYDDNGNLLKSLSKIWSSQTKQLENSYQITYAYDDQGNRIEFLWQNWDGISNVWINNVRKVFVYDSLNRMIEETNQIFWNLNWLNTYQFKYTYDEMGRLEYKVGYDWFDDAWNPNEQTWYIYNAQDQLHKEVKSKWNGKDWEFEGRTLYTYNSDGLEEEVKYQLWDALFEVWEDNIRTIRYYDEAQNLVEIYTQNYEASGWDNVWRRLYSYDTQNRRINEFQQEADNEEDQWEYISRNFFYHNSNINQVIRYNLDILPGNYWGFSSLGAQDVSTYDVDGNLVEIAYQRGTPIGSDWIDDTGCDYYRSTIIIDDIEEIKYGKLVTCSFANPYILNSPITCEGLDFSKKHQVILYDIMGRETWAGTVSNGSFKINHPLSTGTYVLIISNQEGVVYQRKMMVSTY